MLPTKEIIIIATKIVPKTENKLEELIIIINTKILIYNIISSKFIYYIIIYHIIIEYNMI
jgi:hypothetical protein